MHAKLALKNVFRMLSQQSNLQKEVKIFMHAELALKKCVTHSEQAVKNVLPMLSMR
jgi:hypothetical protein